MPRKFEVVCGRCTMECWVPVATTWIELDDGQGAIVGHPGEVRSIEESTGQSFHDVLDADRLHYSRLLVCQSCGTADHYRDDTFPLLSRDAPRRSADELDEDQRREQVELRNSDPERAAKFAASRIGPFDVYARSPERDAAREKSHRHYRRLLGEISEEELGQLGCVSCGAHALDLPDTAAHARDEGYRFECPACGDHAAVASGRQAVS